MNGVELDKLLKPLVEWCNEDRKVSIEIIVTHPAKVSHKVWIYDLSLMFGTYLEDDDLPEFEVDAEKFFMDRAKAWVDGHYSSLVQAVNKGRGL